MMTTREAVELAYWILSHGNPVAVDSDVSGPYIVVTSYWTRPVDGANGTQTDIVRSYSDARAILGY